MQITNKKSKGQIKSIKLENNSIYVTIEFSNRLPISKWRLKEYSYLVSAEE